MHLARPKQARDVHRFDAAAHDARPLEQPARTLSLSETVSPRPSSSAEDALAGGGSHSYAPLRQIRPAQPALRTQRVALDPRFAKASLRAISFASQTPVTAGF